MADRRQLARLVALHRRPRRLDRAARTALRHRLARGQLPKVNAESIGIEHVGETYDPSGFTTAEYQASAHLVAWLVRRYDIPVDRKHIIGHYQVPDPKHPGLFGGYDHHTDPGPHWHWGYYMSLVRRYAFPNLYALHVRSNVADA